VTTDREDDAPTPAADDHQPRRVVRWSFAEFLGEPEPEVGARIGPYVVEGRLGEGGMGAVLRVRDAAGRALALKLLSATRAPAELRERLLREARITAGLAHPGIVVVHDAGEHEGRPYVVYELLEGGDLAQRLPDLDPQARLQIVLAVAEALGHAHAHGVIHRDLKAENVLLDAAGRPRIADFGLAQAIGLERLTRSGVLVGTPVAMAPEQIAGERDRYGPPTDVWALGLLLYQALTGRRAFGRGGGLAALAATIVRARFPAPRAVAPSVDRRLEAVCLRALSARPEDRQPDASTFARELSEALSRPSGSGRRVALAGAAALAGVVAVALAAAPRGAEPPPTPRPAGSAGAGPARAAAPPREPVRLPVARRARRAADAGDVSRLLALLGELAAAGPPTGAPAEADLADDVARRALAEFESDRPRDAVRLLRGLADAGLRVPNPWVGTRLMEAVEFETTALELPPELYWRLLLLTTRLDVPATSERFATDLRVPRPTRPWGSDAGPWEVFVDLCVAVEESKGQEREAAGRRLADLLRDPPVAIGPRQWADAAGRLALGVLPPRAARPLLEAAAGLDPKSPTVGRALAALWAEENPERALGHARRAVELTALRFHPSCVAREQRWPLRTTLRLEIALDRRDAARRTHARLRRSMPNLAGRLAAEHPWLEEEPAGD